MRTNYLLLALSALEHPPGPGPYPLDRVKSGFPPAIFPVRAVTMNSVSTRQE